MIWVLSERVSCAKKGGVIVNMILQWDSNFIDVTHKLQ